MQTTASPSRQRWCSVRRTAPQPLGVGTNDAISNAAWVLVLPCMKDPPASTRQSGVDRLVPCDIPCELGAPVAGIGAGDIAVLGAAMPKASVDEDGKAGASKDNVGADEAVQASEGKIDAEAQASAVEFTAKCQLGAAVAAPVASHALAHPGARRPGIRQKCHGQIQSRAACDLALPTHVQGVRRHCGAE